MKRDYKYTGVLLAVFLATGFIFYLLFKKYSYETLSHFSDSCQRFISIIWPPNVHTFGFILLGFISSLSFIFVSVIIFSYVSFHLKLKKYHALHTNSLPRKLKRLIVKNKITNSITLLESDLPIALCYRFLKPRIFLSTNLVITLPKDQLEAVVLHEQNHANNKHMFLIFVNELIVSILFFFPILKDFTKRVTIFFESEADLFVMSIQKTDKYLIQARKLFGSTDNNSGFVLIPSFSSTLNYESNNDLINRKHLIGSLAFGILLFSLLFLPTNVLAGNHMDSEVITTCLNYQCSTHCTSELDHKTFLVSSNFNYTPIFE